MQLDLQLYIPGVFGIVGTVVSYVIVVALLDKSS